MWTWFLQERKKVSFQFKRNSAQDKKYISAYVRLMMSKGKDLMIITYSAMSKSRAIMALDLNLEKRLLEGGSYFSFATLEKRKKLGWLTFTKTSGTVLLGTGKIIGKLLTGTTQVTIQETIAGYVFWLYSMSASYPDVSLSPSMRICA